MCNLSFFFSFQAPGASKEARRGPFLLSRGSGIPLKPFNFSTKKTVLFLFFLLYFFLDRVFIHSFFDSFWSMHRSKKIQFFDLRNDKKKIKTKKFFLRFLLNCFFFLQKIRKSKLKSDRSDDQKQKERRYFFWEKRIFIQRLFQFSLIENWSTWKKIWMNFFKLETNLFLIFVHISSHKQPCFKNASKGVVITKTPKPCHYTTRLFLGNFPNPFF